MEDLELTQKLIGNSERIREKLLVEIRLDIG